MGRVSDFKYDSAVIGKVGEDDFRKNVGLVLQQSYGNDIFSTSWCITDVSNDEIFQLRDIDFILTSKNRFGDSSVNLCYSLSASEKCKIVKGYYGADAIRVEVKTDTRTFKTRNIVYELISHYRGGCWATTEADIVYYVCVDENNTSKIVGRYVIFARVLRDYIINNQMGMSHLPSDITNPNVPLVMNVVDDKYKKSGSKDDPILNILVNLDTILKYPQIAKEIKI